MITLIQEPQKFTPAGNPIIFQVISDDADILYFKVDIVEATSNAVVSTLDIYPTPDLPTGSYVDLSKILSNVVDFQISNTQNILSLPMSKPLFKYKVKITERVLNVDEIEDGDDYITNTYFVWEAKLNSFIFSEFNYSDYVVSTGLPIKFLTTKPDKTVVNDYSAEMLYFLHETEDDLRVIVKTYNKSNVNLNNYSHSIADLDEYNLFRLQVSPKSLKESVLADFTEVAYYTIHIEDENGDKRSETRTYLYKPLPCHLEPTNMLWFNSLGGVDTYQFVNVQESNQITKNTFKGNIFKVDNGLYSNRTDDIWNAPESVININQQGTYTASSRIINDAESRWFNELFTSRKVFVELGNNSLVPVMIDATNYSIQRQKYNRSTPISIQVNYHYS
ncbi:MAG: hypothetical protein EOP48_16335 [Sphingobacteriales bacterium]|nr:MAG: hypothetical protein EOP48_16335 [Sphingobacteriales bacterium]